VVRVEKKAKQRYAAAPFTTSTLQQEAVRKLGMTADRTMRTAQSLYEGVDIGGQAVGLISYMRTDSVSLAKEAVQEIRDYIKDNFSSEYLPSTQPAYKSKTKNAQESHEAIRPTSILRTPDSVRSHLSADQARLYEMIWKRTLACQMAPARFDTVSMDIRLGGDTTLFRASGQVLVFPGFIGVYMEDVDDAEEEEGGKLPPLAEGDVIPVDKLYGEQHFTQPPPRFSEASLVKSLEEYGIGRPSTYATIISTLQAREYAILDKKAGGAVVISAAALSPEASAVVTLSTQTAGTALAPRLAPRPLLLIHGAEDRRLPPDCSRYVYRIAREPKELVILPGARHSLRQRRDELRRLLRRWLVEKLAPGPGDKDKIAVC